jgi:hypothetical protein
MKRLMPILIALLGLAAGVGAGLALKPAPEAEAAAGNPCPEHSETPCAAAEPPDPFKPAEDAGHAIEGEAVYVPFEKSFVVPVFAGEKVVAMVVVSLSVATDEEGAHAIEAIQPRLRDSFLKVMFRHANSGGFDGHFTTGQKMDDLKSALLVAAREALPEYPVGEIIVTEIARQDV